MTTDTDKLVEMADAAGLPVRTLADGSPHVDGYFGENILPKLVAFRDRIIASLGGDVEPIVWQFRWTNPNNEPHQPPEMTAWEVVEPKYRLQSVEQRLNELRSATYNGKACYEVRALIDASTVAAIKAERDAALARVAELEAAALEGARRIESLKRECSDPESPIAIQNARYMNVSYFLRSALTKGQPAPQPQQEQSK